MKLYQLHKITNWHTWGVLKSTVPLLSMASLTEVNKEGIVGLSHEYAFMHFELGWLQFLDQKGTFNLAAMNICQYPSFNCAL